MDSAVRRRGHGIPRAYRWERSEVEAAWAIALDDYIAGFQWTPWAA